MMRCGLLSHLAVLAALVSSGDADEKVAAFPGVVSKLQSGDPVRIVCFGDSVTGLYYHTGGRRAYTDMLGLALRQAYAKADVTMLNAGISGNTTRDALTRIDRDILEHRPTLDSC